MSLVAIILTMNEAIHVVACIQSVAWADRVLVYDSGSTDDTVPLARTVGADVIVHPFIHYADQRESALRAVVEDWVFFIDADERSSPAQGVEIRARIAEPGIDGGWVPRDNYIMGKLTRGAGWSPDYQLRVLRRAHAHYDMAREVHELVILDGTAIYLQTPLIHYNYRDLAHFLQKQEKYTDLAAHQMFLSGTRVKPQNYLLQPVRHFLWRYRELKGYRDGWHGLRLSLLMAWYELQKYIRLAREWRQEKTT